MYLTEVHGHIIHNGGGTFRAEYDGTFSIPDHTDGYYVSRADAEVQVLMPNMTYQALAQYAGDHAGILAPMSNYLGIWVDEGTVYLDVSTRVKNYQSAIALGRKNGQLAIWDIAAGKAIDLR